MLQVLITFAPIAGLLTVTPGATTALVVRNALRGGRRHAFWTTSGNGLITSLANPKLAVFFVALFPQFVPRGLPVLPAALAMVGVIVAFDLVWYSVLAALVSRARRHLVEGR